MDGTQEILNTLEGKCFLQFKLYQYCPISLESNLRPVLLFPVIAIQNCIQEFVKGGGVSLAKGHGT